MSVLRAATSRFWPDGHDFHLSIPSGNVVENLLRAAVRGPNRTAIHYYGTTLTYADLVLRVEALAGWLQAVAGLKRGERVLLAMQNSPQFIIAFQAILRADAVVVPVNPMSVTREIAYYAADSGARIAIIGDELLERFLPLATREVPQILVARYADMTPDPCAYPLPEVMARPPQTLQSGAFSLMTEALAAAIAPASITTGGNNLAVMPYSSGTTGTPKACRHSHSAVNFTAIAQARWYGLRDDSVLTAFMPLFHVAGMQASMNAGLYAGGALVIMTRWNSDLIPELFERHGVTFWSAAPTMIVDVLASKGFSDRVFAHLTVLTGGGSSMPAAVTAQLSSRYGLSFCEGYGLTETIAATHINPVARPKPQCLGLPIYDTHSRVIDPDTLAERPAGEHGEIIVSGPQVMHGYWSRPDADAEAFITLEGRRWLRTGDLGYVDDEGYFFIVDRIKRMVNVSGFKVWPAECEAQLYKHPAVQECCVIAAPDGHSGETVKALIALRPEARGTVTPDDIAAFARTVMATYKVPKLYEFVESLPRSSSNKIDWRSLQTAEWEKAR